MLMRERPMAARLETAETGGPAVLVIIGSDQGLVGQFNRTLLEHVVATMNDQGEGVGVFGAGRQMNEAIRAEGLDLVEGFSLPRSVDGIARSSEAMLLSMEAYRREHGVSRIRLCHNRPTGSASYEPVDRAILPLSRAWLEELSGRAWPTRTVPMHRSSWQELFSRTVQQHIQLILLRGLGESLAAENASRMAAMQAAESNIEERVGGLRQGYHQQRQQSITAELLDVMAGFEATRQ
jgi:F-type H+-transporting ATPase subunit gamma